MRCASGSSCYFSTKQRGTGLGLAIAAKIVREHDGAIRAEQNSPTGARFIIELPLAEQKNGESQVAESGSGLPAIGATTNGRRAASGRTVS